MDQVTYEQLLTYLSTLVLPTSIPLDRYKHFRRLASFYIVRGSFLYRRNRQTPNRPLRVVLVKDVELVQRVDKSIRAFFHLILNIEFSSHTWLSRYNLFIWSRHWLHSELRYRYLIVHPRVAIIVQIRHSKRSTKFRKFLNAFYAPYVTSRFQAEHIEGVLMSILHHDMHYSSY